MTPFQIIAGLTFSLVVYGMAGLRPGAGPILRNALVNVLTHLVASQARRGGGRGGQGCKHARRGGGRGGARGVCGGRRGI